MKQVLIGKNYLGNLYIEEDYTGQIEIGDTFKDKWGNKLTVKEKYHFIPDDTYSAKIQKLAKRCLAINDYNRRIQNAIK